MRLIGKLILAVLTAVITLSLASCSARNTSTIRTNYWPLVLMPDDTMLLSSNFTIGAVTEIRKLDLHTSKVTLLGRWKGNPFLPVDNYRLIGTGDDDRRPQIYLYDLRTMTRKLLVDQASLERVGQPSPDGTKLLFKKNGLNVVDLQTGQCAKLLGCPILDNAQWYRDSRHVIASCENGKIIRVIDTKKCSASPPSASFAAQFDHGIFTPDMKYITYLSGSKVICQSLKTGKQWTISDRKSAKDEPGLVFSPDGNSLLVWYFRTGDLLVFNAPAQRLTKNHIDLPVYRQVGLYWLKDSKTLLITSFAKNLRSIELTKMSPADWPVVK